MSTTHWSTPVQAPVHLPNVEPALGVATSRTAELFGYAVPHTPASAPRVMEQESWGDASGVVTVPEPAPSPNTRSTWWLTVVDAGTTLSLLQLAKPMTASAAAAKAGWDN